MLGRAQPVMLASLLFAAVGCARSYDDISPWIGPELDATIVDAGASQLPDSGTAQQPSQDASNGGNGGSGGTSGSGGAPAADSGTGMMGDDAAVDGSAPMPPEDASPPGPEPVPDCPPSPVDFDTPPPMPPTGYVAVDLSAWLQPVGVNERALIQVLDDQYQLDTSYAGDLSWTLPEGVEIVDATPVSGGEAEVTFRFAHTGTFELQAALSADPRTGRATVMAYEVQLPVWQLAVDQADLDTILADPGAEIWIAGVLTIDAVPHPTTVRLHGGSSRYYSKKSFRFNLVAADTDPQLPSYGKKLILRAEFNDKSQLRNWLGLRMLREATTLPTPRSKFVHFRINDRYYGLMLSVERVDSHLLSAWGMPQSGSMYEADPVLELASPGGNLTPLSPEQYPLVYQHQSGSIDYLDLRTLIEDTLTLPDAEFAQVVETEVMVDEYIEYLAALAAIQDHDQVRKNYYLYRDPDSAMGWRVIPWDLDLTFGHLWSPENDVLEENIVTDADIFVGAYDPARGDFYNQLTDRVLGVPEYRTRFRALVEQMLDTTISRTNADMLMQAAIRCATPDIVADSRKRADNAEYEARVNEILDYLDARKAFVQGLPQ